MKDIQEEIWEAESVGYIVLDPSLHLAELITRDLSHKSARATILYTTKEGSYFTALGVHSLMFSPERPEDEPIEWDALNGFRNGIYIPRKLKGLYWFILFLYRISTGNFFPKARLIYDIHTKTWKEKLKSPK